MRLSRNRVLSTAAFAALSLLSVFALTQNGCAKVGSGLPVDGGGGSAGTGGAGGGSAGGVVDAAPDVAPFEAPPRSICGNGVIEFGENCDDGNITSGDGCSSGCVVEPHYTCKMASADAGVASVCTHDVVCGDGVIEGAEACDDGNTKSGDGCAMDCTLECGWECPPGTLCRAAKCGDGKIAGDEQCDDGNTMDGDGCSANCTLESKPVGVPEGWICTSPAAAGGDGGAGTCKGPTTCTTSTCGNKIKEGSEQCDDGNTATGDGCSPFCRLEPVCPMGGGPCTTACGDGLLLPIDKANGQECDDGNTVDGDGCSSMCKKEPGFVCTDVSSKPDMLILPIVYHDFKYWSEGDAVHDHPDFGHFPGNGRGFAGIVQPLLGPAGVPIHVAGCWPMPGAGYPAILTANNCASGGNPAPTGPAWDAAIDWFGMWYVDNPTFNKTIVSTLTLPPIAGGAFQFTANGTNAAGGFFPLDGMGWGNTPTFAHNYGFTSVARTWFEYSGTSTLSFLGDDDVWVFVNKKLAVDLGGTHQASSGSVTLDAANGHGYVCDFVTPGTAYPSPACTATAMGAGNGHDIDLGLTIGNVYEIAVFQAERYPTESNYQLTLGGFTGVKSQCKGACGDKVVTPPEKCDLGTAMNTGAYGGCKGDCTLAPYCGDGMVTTPPEECDPTAPGTSNCDKNCKIVTVQ